MDRDLTVEASGDTAEDLAIALEEVIRLIREGFSSGTSSNESGCFDFSIRSNG
jgi:hypothetical protein